MARTQNTEHAEELGRRLTAARVAAGSPPYRDIEHHLYTLFGKNLAPTGETIRRAHAGLADPRGISIETLLGVCDYYGIDIDELGSVAADRVDRIRRLLAAPSITRGYRGAIGGVARRHDRVTPHRAA